MHHSKTTPIIATIVVVFALLTIAVLTRTQPKPIVVQNTNTTVVANTNSNTNTNTQVSRVCTDPSETTMIGSVFYPVADAYKNLPGLGQFFTAADCGSARLAEVSAKVLYGLVGGALVLKNPPSGALLTVLQSAGFMCSTKDSAKACLSWKVSKEPAVSVLLKLKSFVSEFVSEECALCG